MYAWDVVIVRDVEVSFVIKIKRLVEGLYDGE